MGRRRRRRGPRTPSVPEHKSTDAESLRFQNKWCLWHDTHWKNQKRLYCVGNIADFWRLFNNVPAIDAWPPRSNLSFFKSDVPPTWEHDANKNGGKWVISLREHKDQVERVWMNAVMALVGETVDPDNEITGIQLNLRHGGDRFALWVRGTELDKQRYICDKFLSVVGLPAGANFTFKSHASSIENNSCFNAPPLLQIVVPPSASV